MQTLFQDLRYGIRMLLNAPGFTLVATLTLALGIGINTSIFTLFNVFLRPLPVNDPETLVTLDWGTSERRWFAYPDYVYFRENGQVFSGLIARDPEQIPLEGREAREETLLVNAELVSDNFFSLLGVRAILGRTFTPEENSATGKQPVVVLSHHFWQSYFAGDPNVIGRVMRFHGKPFTVIGVMERGFSGIDAGPETKDVWLPMAMRPEVGSRPAADDDSFRSRLFGSRDIRELMLTGRLKPGRTMEEARAEMKLLSAQFVSAYPEIDPKNSAIRKSVRVTPAARLPADARGFWPMVGIVLAATALVLLIACSNIASLLLARATARRKEIGVRLCLGASRLRVIRQLLTESLLLAGLGGIAGLVLAWWSVSFLVAAVLSRIGDEKVTAAALNLDPDIRILSFTFLISVLSAIAFGLVPALRATRLDLVATIKDEGAALGHRIGRSRLRNGLVVVQVAVCLTLLMSAGLLLRGLTRATTRDPGFETKKVLLLELNLDYSGYTAARAEQFKRDLSARLAALPGVQAVVPDGSPMWDGAYTTITVPASEGTAVKQFHDTPYLQVSHNYFDAVGIRIVRGRGFTEEETRAGAAVAVVSETTARNLWPGADPLGKEMRMESNASPSDSGAVRMPTVQVIGVARDVLSWRTGEVLPLKFFVPATEGLSDLRLVRTVGDASQLKPLVWAVIRSLDPSIYVYLNTLEETIARTNRVRATNVSSLLATTLGLLALLLATIGIYGVMSFAVSQRTREIGIRVALGAQGRDVMKLVIRQGMVMVLIGVAIGLAASMAVSRLIKSLLFGISPTDPMTFVMVPLLLAAVALLACYIPARRATKVDPMVALRYE
jgi:macrolide transport system ATP-binding/permease protein